MKMKRKKGIETVVAWVLILGFSITLGTFVFMWATRSTQKMTESTLSYVEGGMQCEQVQIDALFSDYAGSSSKCMNVTITNRGYLTIEQVIVRGVKTSGESIAKQTIDKNTNTIPGIPLLPKRVTNGVIPSSWNFPDSGATIDFIPVVKDKNTLISCSDKLKTVKC